jgi:Skp family chaperone for outer membrane proteins
MSDATKNEKEAALDEKVKKFRERMRAREAEIKGAIARWIQAP